MQGRAINKYSNKIHDIYLDTKYFQAPTCQLFFLHRKITKSMVILFMLSLQKIITLSYLIYKKSELLGKRINSTLYLKIEL